MLVSVRKPCNVLGVIVAEDDRSHILVDLVKVVLLALNSINSFFTTTEDARDELSHLDKDRLALLFLDEIHRVEPLAKLNDALLEGQDDQKQDDDRKVSQEKAELEENLFNEQVPLSGLGVESQVIFFVDKFGAEEFP